MSRRPSDPATAHGSDFATETSDEMAQEVSLVREIDQVGTKVATEAFDVIRTTGAVQALRAVSVFTNASGLLKLAEIKKTKAYKSLKGVKTPNGTEIDGTWEGYCRHGLGVSPDKIDADLASVALFGHEVHETMQGAGIGYRELRQLRKLPDDERTALIEAAKDGDKDSLLDLAEALIEKHAKEKERAAKEKDALEGELAARDERIAKQRERIEKVEDESDRLRAKLNADEVRKKADPDAELESLEAVLTHHRSIIEVNILGPLRLAAERLLEASRAAGQTKEEIISAAFLQLQRAIEDTRLEVGVKAMPTGDGDLAWLKEDWAQPGYIDPKKDSSLN
jgi:hypothetical protein